MQRSNRWGALALFIALAGSSAMAWAELPAGYRLAQKLVTPDGSVLQVLEDQRISAQLHSESWGNGLDEDSFDEPGDLVDSPLREAQVRLVSASGEVIAHEDLGYPLAQVEKAPLKGLPEPVYFLTIDQTAPMGSYSGPATQLLLPDKQQLKPLSYQGTDGKAQTSMGKNLKAADLTSEAVQKKTDAELANQIANGKGKMAAYEGILGKQGVENMVKYVRTLKAK